MTRTLFFLSLIALSVTAVIYYLIPYQHAQKPKVKINRPVFGGVYHRSLPGVPQSLDPVLCTDTTAAEVLGQIFSRLFRLNNNLEVVPDLARRYEVALNKKEYMIWLRKKVRFHTITQNGLLSQNKGREVVASDVKFTLERLLDPQVNSPNKNILSMIEGAEAFSHGKASEVRGIKVIDKHLIQIKLKNPFSPFVSVLTSISLGIVPHEDVRFWGEEFKHHPVGSGPFIFEGYDRVKSILSLRSNLDFHRGRPFLDRVEFHVEEKDYSQFQLFQSKGLFHIDRIPLRNQKDMVKNSAYRFKERAALQVTYLGMNLRIKPFDQKSVRKAINHTVNKNMIVRHILQNRGLAAQGPLPKGIPGYNSELGAYAYNLNKSREYLKRAGYRFNEKGMVLDFPALTLQIPTSESSQSLADIVQSNLADIGIQVNLKVVPWREHFEQIDKDEVAFFSLGWLADYPDADNILYSNFHTSSIQNFYNSSRFSDSTVDQLLDQARETGNENERIKLYREAEKIITDEAPWVFLHYPTTYILHHPGVHGIELSPLGASEIDYFRIWLDSTLSQHAI